MPIYQKINANLPIQNGVAVGRAPQVGSTQGPDYWHPTGTAGEVDRPNMDDLAARLARFRPDDYYQDGPTQMSAGDVSATGTANAAQVVTYPAAGASLSHVITGFSWSYSGTPTGGHVKIEDGSGNVVFQQDIVSSGAGFFDFPGGRLGSANTALVITLSAGGASVTGELSVKGHKVV